MEKDELSQEEINADMIVGQTVELIDGVITATEKVKETLYDAFDFTKPERWAEIYEEVKSALGRIEAELKTVDKKIDEKYLP